MNSPIQFVVIKTFHALSLSLRLVLLGGIYIWHHFISPFFGPRCRFYPSCSQYARESLNQDPLCKALIKTVVRLLKCHPFHPGGIDLP